MRLTGNRKVTEKPGDVIPQRPGEEQVAHAQCLCSREQHDFIEFIGHRIFPVSKQIPALDL